MEFFLCLCGRAPSRLWCRRWSDEIIIFIVVECKLISHGVVVDPGGEVNHVLGNRMVLNDVFWVVSGAYYPEDPAGWEVLEGHMSYLGIVVHYLDRHGDLQDLPIALPQLTGAHSGERMAEVVSQTLQQFSISSCTVG